MSFSGTFINSANTKAGLIIEESGNEMKVIVLTDTSGSGTYKVRGQGPLLPDKDSYKADMALCDGRRLLLELKPGADSLGASFTFISDLDAEGLQAVEQYQYAKVPDGSIKT